MTQFAASAHHAWLALGAVVVWGVLSFLSGYVRLRWRPTCQWCLVALGVPVLGWVTYALGPVVGMAVFGLGLCLLIWHPRAAPRRSLAQRGSRPAAE
ncbi:DUF2484 family protein [Paracoccus sp. DMF-8]|uniref:DUF2484 family protein n=1 Tax=Paracoccus sp. DMF-8 TaxID=3019445 RepID=UPI0023E7BE4A|nr:DUF2484 family protein [Paracoccus sp. DMF-8]MDF3605604.1 DUF2484 family protein [Paracoccus sp. DMF-8]